MHSSELNHICDFHCHRGALGNVLLQGFLFKVVMHIYIYLVHQLAVGLAPVCLALGYRLQTS